MPIEFHRHDSICTARTTNRGLAQSKDGPISLSLSPLVAQGSAIALLLLGSLAKCASSSASARRCAGTFLWVLPGLGRWHVASSAFGNAAVARATAAFQVAACAGGTDVVVCMARQWLQRRCSDRAQRPARTGLSMVWRASSIGRVRTAPRLP
jgi:hypothetical protein